jgi:hypothetical protein
MIVLLENQFSGSNALIPAPSPLPLPQAGEEKSVKVWAPNAIEISFKSEIFFSSLFKNIGINRE